MKKQFQKDMAGIILRHIKSHKGLETLISENAGINRDKFNIDSLANVSFGTLLCIIYGLIIFDTEEGKNMLLEIWELMDKYRQNVDIQMFRIKIPS